MKTTWIVLAFCLQLLLTSACDSNRKATTMQDKPTQDKFQKLREQMVVEQLMSRDIKDERVLAAMRKVPRHAFIPDNYLDMAYNDTPLPIGSDQTISQPYIVAYMTEQICPTRQDTVLEIGTGSGYQAAVLAELSSLVCTIEIVPELGEQAQKILQELGYQNIKVKIGDGYYGWPEFAPFDAIILTAAPKQIPATLLQQLKSGGRLIAPIGDEYQELVLITRKGDEYKQKRLIPVRFVPMTGEIQKR